MREMRYDQVVASVSRLRYIPHARKRGGRQWGDNTTSPTAYTLCDLEHLCSAATHHLRLILIRQGTKQPVDVLLGLKSYGPNMREVRAPQDTVSTYQRDHLRTIGIIDQPMIDAG